MKKVLRFWQQQKKQTIIATIASRALFHQEIYVNEACELFKLYVIKPHILTVIQQK